MGAILVLVALAAPPRPGPAAEPDCAGFACPEMIISGDQHARLPTGEPSLFHDGPAGTAASSYDPASATGIIPTKRNKGAGGIAHARDLSAPLHRTGLHP